MKRLISLAQLALLAAALAAAWYGYGLAIAPEHTAAGGALLIGALLAFGALAFWSVRGGGVGLLAGAGGAPAPLRRIALLAVPGAGAAAAAAAFLVAQDERWQPWPVLGLWALGCALIPGGVWLVERSRRGPGEPAGPPVAAWEAPALTAVTLAALAARALQLSQVPAMINGDEGEMGEVARLVLSGQLRDPFATAWLGHPTLWFFMQAGALRLFGDDLVGLRMLSALLGAAAVPACYVYARPLHGRAVALWAAALLAASNLHVHYSRVALNNIGDPLFALLALACFARAWRRGAGRPLALLALAGVFAGVAQHFYTGARLIPLLFAGLLVHQAIFDRPLLRARLGGLALMAVGAAAGAGPLLTFLASHPDQLWARLEAQGYAQTGRLAEDLARGRGVLELVGEQLWRSFGAYVAVIDAGIFYASEIPLLTQAWAAFFLCGVAAALWRARGIAGATLLGWVALTSVLGGALLVDPPQSMRYVIAAPAICLLTALGVAQVAAVARSAAGAPPRAGLAAAALLAALLAAADLWFYFGVYSPRLRYGSRELTGIAYYLRDRRPGDRAFFLGAPYAFLNNGIIRFTDPGLPGEDVLEPIRSPDEVPAPPDGGRGLYIALPAREAELALVAARFPGGRRTTFPDPLTGKALFTVYEQP